MSDSGLVVIVPSRGRPESLPRMVRAWLDTEAYADATLVFAIDADDPRCAGYYEQELPKAGHTLVEIVVLDTWLPMVHKLNRCAVAAAETRGGWQAVGFMGDDHLPRTKHWPAMMLAQLDQHGPGIVYGDDGFQGERLATHWIMSAEIVRELGRMVPAGVEHMYCDNSIMDVGRAANCLHYLPGVRIEHMHPLAGKAKMDAGYARVNRQEQYRRDERAYRDWRAHEMGRDAAKIRALREVRAHGERVRRPGGAEGATSD